MSEISAGAIVYTIEDSQRKYLIIKDFHGNYGFPKGHLEENETTEEAAVREISEETGVSVRLDTSFKEEVSYTMPNGIDKKVVYYLASFDPQSFQRQPEEIDEILLLPYEEAMAILTFDNMKEVLKKAEKKLNSSDSSLIQSIKFIIFSISAGVIQLLSFALFNDVIRMGWWPSYLISLILSVLWNFTLNRNFTFKSASNIPLAMFKVFIYYCIFTPLTTIGGNYLTSVLGLNDYFVTLLNMAINLVTEFLYQKYYVFRDSLNR